METLEQKKRRLFGRKYLPEYLTALSRLLKREVQPTELLSIVETDNFINSNGHFKGKGPDYKETINFSDKDKLMAILHHTISDWDIPYLIYLSQSLDCGLMRIPSLYNFNWDFEFNDEKHGIIVLMRIDGVDRILLDFYEEYSERLMEIGIYKNY